ncbi:hypothetical protein ACOZ38_44255 [Sphaerisporangium viridialbum]|uniref:hypothetical protein n=1 Tax=Sphaerisporangium viridialbum TaxID=46189 RepID=UPI003C78D184
MTSPLLAFQPWVSHEFVVTQSLTGTTDKTHRPTPAFRQAMRNVTRFSPGGRPPDRAKEHPYRSLAWVNTTHTTRPEDRATAAASTTNREWSPIPRDSPLRSNNLMTLCGKERPSISQADRRLMGTGVR